MSDDDPYKVLGVTEGVTPANLKKAYYRQIREHPPETDPDGFQRVQRAYQTASDPRYPIQRQHGKEIETLLTEVGQLMEKGEFATAVRPLKKVLVLDPAHDVARNFLGICQTQTSEWEDAKRTYTRLIVQNPDDVTYRVNYAWVFINQSNSLDRNPEAEARLASEARTQLDEARKRDPDHPVVLRAYAKSYEAQADWPQAIEWMEKAAAARSPLDIDDYTYLVRLQALSDRTPASTGVADRLADRLTDEGKKAAGSYLAKEAIEFYERHIFNVAHALILAADRIHPDDPNISSVCDRWVNAAEANIEFQRMKADDEMNPAVRGLCAVYLDQARGLEFDTPIDTIFANLGDALKTWDDHELTAAARRVQRRYPAVYRLRPDTFDEMAGEKAAKSIRNFPRRPRRVAPPPQAPPPPPAPPTPAPPPAPLLVWPTPARVSIPTATAVDPPSASQPPRPTPQPAPSSGCSVLLLGAFSLACCCACGLFALWLEGAIR